MLRIIIALVFLLAAADSHAECKKFARDLHGRLMSTRCGSKNPAFACPPLRAWDGHNCIKIPIVERCQSQGGTWTNTQFYYNRDQSTFLDVCQCPQGKSWNGRNCVILSPKNVCTSYNQDAVPVHVGLIRHKHPQTPILSCERFPS